MSSLLKNHFLRSIDKIKIAYHFAPFAITKNLPAYNFVVYFENKKPQNLSQKMQTAIRDHFFQIISLGTIKLASLLCSIPWCIIKRRLYLVFFIVSHVFWDSKNSEKLGNFWFLLFSFNDFCWFLYFIYLPNERQTLQSKSISGMISFYDLALYNDEFSSLQ